MSQELSTRRRFLYGTSVAFAVTDAPIDLGQDVARALRLFRIWDGHTHLLGFPGDTPEQKMEAILRAADRMGVERVCLFLGFPTYFYPTPGQIRVQNDQVLRAVKHSGGRAFGYAFVYPGQVQASLDEINRCVRDGPMIGLKFEFDTPGLAAAPELDPLIARAGELGAVVLHHTYIKTTGNEVGESTPVELAQLARRHPSVSIVCGHTGATWELGLRPIRNLKNVYCDLSGSDPTSGFTEAAVRAVGPERVMYGSDVGGRGFASQLAKVMGADISDEARNLILGGNLRRVLGPILAAKGSPA